MSLWRNWLAYLEFELIITAGEKYVISCSVTKACRLFVWIFSHEAWTYKAFSRNCDPVLNPKRSVRIWELRERLTDCTCRNRVSRAAVEHHASSKGVPGWWAFEIQKAVKRSAQG